jgi:hypothetical protein
MVAARRGQRFPGQVRLLPPGCSPFSFLLPFLSLAPRPEQQPWWPVAVVFPAARRWPHRSARRRPLPAFLLFFFSFPSVLHAAVQ